MSEHYEHRRKQRKIQICWNDECVHKLIVAVKSEQLLWNPSLQEYKHRVKRDAAWKSISENVFSNEIDPIDLNMKWQNLRCQYKELINKKTKHKDNQNYIIRWRYYDQMKFISLCDRNATSKSSLVLSMVNIFLTIIALGFLGSCSNFSFFF